MRTNWITAKPGPGARMAELRFSGRVASGGFATGPLAVLLNAAGGARGAGEPAAEAQALRQAIASALGQLMALAARAESDGADILAFQIAMLEDETLGRPPSARSKSERPPIARG